MNLANLTSNKVFNDLTSQIETGLKEVIKTMGIKNRLRDACEYVLLSKGKRFRPLIALLLANSLDQNRDVLYAALACEFFHVASLIADDLPCMDNEAIRRGQPALHIAFGEHVAILASYALISAGYELIYKNSEILAKNISQKRSDRLCVLAMQTVSKYAGIHGAAGGQFLDLFAEQISSDLIIEIIHKKTISLFEIAFVMGWLFGGGEIDQLDKIKKCSYHFGMAFQIADDLQDFEQDLSKKKRVNIAIALGKEKAYEIFKREINKTKSILKYLNVFSFEIKSLIEIIENNLRT